MKLTALRTFTLGNIGHVLEKGTVLEWDGHTITEQDAVPCSISAPALRGAIVHGWLTETGPHEVRPKLVRPQAPYPSVWDLLSAELSEDV